ncbi:MAG: DoxX family protein [bacterium]
MAGGGGEESAKDVGLLFVRVIVGFSMAAFHGWGKISGGPELWKQIGGAMGNFGVHAYPVFWGFMSGFAEFGCSCLMALGVFFRPATLILAINMAVAVGSHLAMPPGQHAGWNGASHALELFSVYVALLLVGPGKFALKKRR